jgi:uncharacterized membrane protein
MQYIFSHLKKFIGRGVLAAIPVGLVALLISLVYGSIDQNVVEVFYKYIGFKIPGLGIIAILLCLYLLGLISSNIVGKWFLHLIEKVANRIPVIGKTYQVGKQISNTLRLPEKQVFKKVVLVNYLKDDIFTVGFITGSIINRKNNQKLYKVFIPTPPIPTTGVLVIVEEKQMIDPGWSLDEGIKTVISGGIIGPSEIR